MQEDSQETSRDELGLSQETIDQGQRDKKLIIDELLNLIDRHPGETAKWLVDRQLNPYNARVHAILQEMRKTGRVRVERKRLSQKSIELHFIEPLWYDGAKHSYRSLAAHADNVHGLSFQAIQLRMKQGMTAAQSLSEPKAERVKRNKKSA